MKPLIYARGKIVPVSEEAMFVSDDALFGKGIFTTVRIINSSPLLWEKHWRRLNETASRLALDISQHSEDAVLTTVRNIVAENGVINGRVRITFLEAAPAEKWFGPGRSNVELSIIVAASRDVVAKFRLTLSPHRLNCTSPLAGMKTCNYLDKLLMLNEATARGFDEAVVVNESGEVASAVTANLFWVKDGGLFTPRLATGCLPGTTREYVLENIDCVEVQTDLAALDAADAIYLTSAGLGVVRVAEFDGRPLFGKRHPIESVRNFFSKL